MTPERLRVLCLDSWCPSPATDGARLRRLGLLRGLAARHDVTLACCVVPGRDDPSQLEQAGVGVVPWPAVPVPSRRRAILTGRPTCMVPGNVDVPPPLAGHPAFDVAFGPLCVAPALRATGLPWAVDDMNVEHDLYRQHFLHEAPGALKVKRGADWAEVRAYERRWLRRADHVVCCSEADRRVLGRIARSVPVSVVPSVVDVAALQFPLAPRRPGLVLHVGALDYAPNADAVRFLVERVMPELRRRHPGVRLRIVGASPGADLLAARSEDVEVTGAVPDLAPHLGEAALTIVPLRTGGGTRLKVLEAMASGVPVVATPRAVEGLPLTPGVDVRVGAREELAGLAAELLRDEGLRLAQARAARAAAEAHGSIAAGGRLLDEVLRAVVARAGAGRRSR